MRLHATGRLSTAPQKSALTPGRAGLRVGDHANNCAKSDDQEDGFSARGATRRWTGLHDDIDLIGLIPSWHREAACAAPDVAHIDFFRDHAKAREVCWGCPVKGECLSEALRLERETRLCYGVRGGLTATAREELIHDGLEVGVIYYGERDGLIKIGTTRRDVRLRTRDLGLTVLATEPGSYTRESEIHGWFASLRVHGEWFRPATPLMDYIAHLAEPVVEQVAS